MSDEQWTTVLAACCVALIVRWFHNRAEESAAARHEKIMDTFEALQDYLYETDPQFAYEYELERQLFHSKSDFGGLSAGIELDKLEQEKRAEGKRTRNQKFVLR